MTKNGDAGIRLTVVALEGHPTDRRVWSGIPHAVTVELARVPGVQLRLIGPLAPVTRAVGRFGSAATRRTGHKIHWIAERRAQVSIGNRLRRELKRQAPCDAALLLGFAPIVPPSLPPIISWGDATNAQRVDVARNWSHLSRRTLRSLERTEGEALRSLDCLVMSSDWAANDARDRYGLEQTQVHTVPFGSNAHVPDEIPRRTPGCDEEIRLLLVGVDWKRKGADVAVGAVDELVRRGRRAVLDVVGVLPPGDEWRRSYVNYHGFLSKDDPSTACRLDELYREASVMVLPSRHDPTPIVVAEAAAYGLPVVASDVCGIPERVVDGRTGVLLGAGSPGSAYADAVEYVIADGDRYARFCANSRERHEGHLSWRVAIDQLLDIVARTTEGRAKRLR